MTSTRSRKTTARRKGRRSWARQVPPNLSATDRRIVALLQAGVRPTAINHALRVPRNHVDHVRARLGLPALPHTERRRHDADWLIPVVLAMRQAGLSYDIIALRVNANRYSLIDRITRRLGPLPHACQYCGSPAVNWHHLSYVPERTLALCRPCHTRQHAPWNHAHDRCSPPSPGATPSKKLPLTAN